MVRLQYRRAAALAIALLLVAGAARGEEAAPAPPTDSLPGSSTPPGLGLSPEAPPVPPAPGGRAPSFGAPGPRPAFVVSDRRTLLRLGGGRHRQQAGQSAGRLFRNGHTRAPAFDRQDSVLGRRGRYLEPAVRHLPRDRLRQLLLPPEQQEYQGYANTAQGPAFGTAYLLVTPDPIGTLRLQFRVGAFTENYAGPGQWGWGIFGPMLALRGYGETANGEWDLNRDLRSHVDARIAGRSRRA